MWLVSAVFFFFIAILVWLIMSRIVSSNKKRYEKKLKKAMQKTKQKNEELVRKGNNVIEMRKKINKKIKELEDKNIDVSQFSEESEEIQYDQENSCFL